MRANTKMTKDKGKGDIFGKMGNSILEPSKTAKCKAKAKLFVFNYNLGPDGRVYFGDFVHNQLEGKGIFNYPN